MTFEARLSSNLLRRRNGIGLSQGRVAVRASLSSATVGKLEAGQGIPMLDTLIRLAGALSTTPSDLLDGIIWRPGFIGDGPGRYKLGESARGNG